jgi:hypothetical protein
LNNEGTKKQSDAGVRPFRTTAAAGSFQRGAKVFLCYFVTMLFNFLVKLTA